MHCNIDFSSSDLLLNGQVSIQRLQDNNDKMYKRTIIFFPFLDIEFASYSIVFDDGFSSC